MVGGFSAVPQHPSPVDIYNYAEPKPFKAEPYLSVADPKASVVDLRGQNIYALPPPNNQIYAPSTYEKINKEYGKFRLGIKLEHVAFAFWNLISLRLTLTNEEKVMLKIQKCTFDETLINALVTTKMTGYGLI